MEDPVNRPFILSHRSVRGIRLTLPRVALMIVTAGTVSLSVFLSGHWLLNLHQESCQRILEAIGVSVTTISFTMAPVAGAIAATLVDVPALAGNRVAMLSIGVAILALVAVHRAFPVARSLVFFVLSLLAVSLAMAFLNPQFRVDSGSFIRLWIGTQFALWMAIPWVCAFLVMPIEPSALRGIAWVVAIGIYAFFWSILRLAFCLGVLHYTGAMFLTGLWFGFGPLADLLYVLVFYSLAVRHASLRVWGYRAHADIRG
jgi:hypothetical protein